jgi:hypothetical protein
MECSECDKPPDARGKHHGGLSYVGGLLPGSAYFTST